MKKIFFPLFTFVHLGLIIWFSCSSSYNTYCDFYKLPKNKSFTKVDKWMADCTPVGVYGRFTGVETGYGFFAPNVRSNGLLLCEYKNKMAEPLFHSFEGRTRFGALSSATTDFLLQKLGNPEGKKNTLAQEKIERYFSVIFKGIARKTSKDVFSNEADSIGISYALINYPALVDAQKQKKIIPELLKIKNFKF